MRFRLVCIGIVMIIFIAVACSKTEAHSHNEFYKVEQVGYSMGLRLYRVTVNGETNYVLRSNNGGLCVLK